MKDFYYILGVNQTASTEEIKKAYRKLSQKFHPDKNDGDEFFAERFKEINEAYETLSDPTRRNLYNLQKAGSNSSQQANSGSNFSPVIEYFKSDKSSFEFEEEITFSWKTINANKVTIKPFGQVQPIGQKTYKFKELKKAQLSFELVAENTNIGRQTSAMLTLTNRTFQDLYVFFKRKIDAENQEKTNRQQSQQQRDETQAQGQNIKTQKELDTESDKAARPIFIGMIILIILVFFIIFSSSK